MPQVKGQDVDRARGKRLASARDDLRLSQPQLAELVGVSPRTIWGREVEGQPIPWPALRLTARVLGVRDDWILHGTEPRERAEADDAEADLAARVDSLAGRVNRLDSSLGERVGGLEARVRSLVEAVEGLALAEPLPAQADTPPREARQPREETEPAKD